MLNRILEIMEKYPGSDRYKRIVEDLDVLKFLIQEFPQYNPVTDTSLLVTLLKMGLKEVPKCQNPECDNKVNYQNRKFTDTCSQTCRRAMDKRTGKMTEIIEKARTTYKERTGFDHQMLNPEIKNKILETNNERYGVDNPMQNAEIRNKAIATVKRKSISTDIKQRAINTIRKKEES